MVKLYLIDVGETGPKCDTCHKCDIFNMKLKILKKDRKDHTAVE